MGVPGNRVRIPEKVLEVASGWVLGLETVLEPGFAPATGRDVGVRGQVVSSMTTSRIGMRVAGFMFFLCGILQVCMVFGGFQTNLGWEYFRHHGRVSTVVNVEEHQGCQFYRSYIASNSVTTKA